MWCVLRGKMLASLLPSHHLLHAIVYTLRHVPHPHRVMFPTPLVHTGRSRRLSFIGPAEVDCPDCVCHRWHCSSYTRLTRCACITVFMWPQEDVGPDAGLESRHTQGDPGAAPRLGGAWEGNSMTLTRDLATVPDLFSVLLKPPFTSMPPRHNGGKRFLGRLEEDDEIAGCARLWTGSSEGVIALGTCVDCGTYRIVRIMALVTQLR